MELASSVKARCTRTPGVYESLCAGAGTPYSCGMNEEQSNRGWLATPCHSDAWPYSSDVPVFEARRAVGHLARTFGVGLNPSGLDDDDSDADPSLRYIYSVRLLEVALETIKHDLVAEARTRGVTWDQIGRALDTKRAGAHNRFNSGISAGRLDELRDEAWISRLAAEVAKPRPVPRGVVDDLSGATPSDRLNYLGRQAIEIISDIRDRDLLSEPTSEDRLEAMKAVARKVRRLGMVVTADHAMWKAVMASAGQPKHVDQANYYAPATYLLHVMRMLLHAWAILPDEDCTDVARFRAGLDEASRIYSHMFLILERVDVSSVVPCQCGGTWDNCDGTCVARLRQRC